MSSFSSNQHFSMNPVGVDLKRSTFNRANTHKTTFDAGKLVPIYLEEVLPGDTFSMNYSYVCRMATPLYPTMDTANLDIYFFYVPWRIIWDDFKKFMGENDNAWITGQTEITIPQVLSTHSKSDEGFGDKLGYRDNELAAYMGVPVLVRLFNSGNGINHLPFRAYAKIWNDWFRDQNTQQTIFYKTDSTSTDLVNFTPNSVTETSFYQTVQYGKELAPVNKYHDYFTSCLPGPQKGNPVTVPLVDGWAPIRDYGYSATPSTAAIPERFRLYNKNGGVLDTGGNIGISQLGIANGNTGAPPGFSNPRVYLGKAKRTGSTAGTDYYSDNDNDGNRVPYLRLAADLRNVQGVGINELRQAFAIQRLLERDARGGTRYIEIIRSHFGVISPDARLQRSEYLGGGRHPIVIEQVLQTSSTTGNNALGATGAFSLTAEKSSGFTKSFTEHGYIIGLAAVRVQHSYGQGLDRLWSRKRKYDIYWPALANIGEQPVFKKEIYFTGLRDGSTDNTTNNQPFGYQEAWAEYRYRLNQVTGKFNPAAEQSLKSWTYVDTYTTAPTLNAAWMQENKSNVAQTLAIQNQPQFIADFFFNNKATRAMPVYSIPGLLDHN